MSRTELEVRQFVIENFVYEEGTDRFSNDDSFLELGLLDSMGIMALVDFVAKTYGIPIENNELVPNHWDSVRRIGAFVDAKLKQKPARAEDDGEATRILAIAERMNS